MKRPIVTLAFTFIAFMLYGQFEPPIEIGKTTATMTDFITMDMDGDELEDIVAVRAKNDEFFWMKNLGAGNFDKPVTFSKDAKGITKIVKHDLDGDGRLDIIGISSSAFWFKNLKPGRFGPRQKIPFLIQETPILKVGDIDGDGDADIIQAHRYKNRVYWMKNDGKGNFGSPQNISYNTAQVSSIMVADLDEDGDLDVYSGSHKTQNIVRFENLGNGNFVVNDEQIVAQCQIDPEALITVDLDNDGDLDLVTKDRSWENVGKGVFNPERKLGNQLPITTQFSDLDGDGDPDFWGLYVGKLHFYENNGKGSFSRASIDPLEPAEIYYSTTIIYEDLDNDGDDDVLPVGSFQVAWFENQGSQEFSKARVAYTVPSRARSFMATDIDGDGTDDLVYTTQVPSQIVWKENFGNGFSEDHVIAKVNLFGSHYTSELIPGDLDGDGRDDIIFNIAGANNTYTPAWVRNLGNGGFSAITKIGETTRFVKLADDFDQDGDIDLIIQNPGLYLLENKGNGTFEAEKEINNLRHRYSISSADIDNDGDLDIVTDISWHGDGFRWYENTGEGRFKTHQFMGVEHVGLYYALPIDVDRDGNIDVLQFNGGVPRTIHLNKNLGNGKFASPVVYDTTDLDFYYENFGTAGMGDIQVEDLDKDGDLDMFLPYHGSGVLWLENRKSEGFETGILIDKESNVTSQPIIFAWDMDDDGDVDIVESTVDSFGDKNRILWHENALNIPFKLRGTAFYDVNENGKQEPGELGLRALRVKVDSNEILSYANHRGEYTILVNAGLHTVKPDVDGSIWKLTSDSGQYTRSVDSTNTEIKGLNFGYFPKNLKTELDLKVRSTRARCNSVRPFWISISNSGNTVSSGVFQFKIDDSLGYDSADPKPDSIVGSTLYWGYKNLFPTKFHRIRAYLEIPGVDTTGRKLVSIGDLKSLDKNGSEIFSTSYKLEQIIRCSFDPNDKLVTPVGEGEDGRIDKDQLLTYKVRFQNTGNDTAYKVVIKDQLDPNLNRSTMKMIASSHPYEMSINKGGETVFTFDSIMLPDSHVNEPASHGFVEYEIELIKNLAPNTRIGAPARIYFDYNPPIYTNTVINTIRCYTAPKPSISLKSRFLEVDSIGDTSNYTYQWFYEGDTLEGATKAHLEPDKSGDYVVQLTDFFVCSQTSEPYTHLATDLERTQGTIGVRIYPNPSTNETHLAFANTAPRNVEISSLLGTVVYSTSTDGELLSLNMSSWSPGVYLVKVEEGSKKEILRLVKK